MIHNVISNTPAICSKGALINKYFHSSGLDLDGLKLMCQSN